MQPPPPGDWPGIKHVRYGVQRGSTPGIHPWVVDLETKIIRGEAVLHAARQLRNAGFVPDVIVAHPGWGESLFLKEVWPQVRAKRPQARFFLVGRDPAAAVQALNGQDGITVTGTVEDPADWIAKAAVCVAPIRAAAGLQNKLLEAMAMAKAVVATPVANEGIRAPEGEAVLLAQEPAPFAAAVETLLADAALRQRLGAAARRFVEAKWTWEGPFLELEQAFLAAVPPA